METKPAAVTIFPHRARVTRAGRLTLEPGLRRIEITNLPLALIPESVRASGKGAARAKLLGVSTRLENYLETPAEMTLELETKVQEVNDADANLAARSLVLEKEQRSIDGLAEQSEMFARGLALRNRTPEEQGLLLDFLTRRSQAIQTELLALARSRREKAKELDRLKRLLQNQHATRPKQRYTATIEIEVLTTGTLDIELTYLVNQAGWKPLYDLRMNELNLEVSYLAQVTQNTGEDWPDVALTLSTAEPSLSLKIPELEPWYIAPPAPIYPVRPLAKSVSEFRPQAAPAPASMPDLAAGGAPAEAALEMEEMVSESTTVSAAGANLTYELKNHADIPGNGDPRKVTVTSFSLNPTLDYVTAPKLEEVCYRRARVKNESAYSLLAGPAQLFEGENYLGTTQLDFVAPNQEFELVLGSDERLRVNRDLRARDVEKAFIMTDRKRIRYSYSIDLENLRDAPQTVFVRDQLPVPRDEQIKVKLESAEPRPTEHTHLNLLEWKMTLAPGAKPIIHFEFSVEFPRALDVIGLP